MSESLILDDAEATERAGATLARCLDSPSADVIGIFLNGELGAGKTTFARGLLRGLGHAGRVPSPTYTLVEPYKAAGWRIYHLDLYRLQDGAELEYLGVAEMAEPGSVLLVEWASRAPEINSLRDLEVNLKVVSEGRSLELKAHGARGRQLQDAFAAACAP